MGRTLKHANKMIYQ